jgi:hypothetical protein
MVREQVATRIVSERGHIALDQSVR